MIGIRDIRVLDPANGRDDKRNLLIAEGKIVSADAKLEDMKELPHRDLWTYMCISAIRG